MPKINAPRKSQNVKIGEAAKVLGVSIDTLRRWEKSGKILTVRTPGGTRLYPLKALKDFSKNSFSVKSLIPSLPQPINTKNKPLSIDTILEQTKDSAKLLDTTLQTPQLKIWSEPAPEINLSKSGGALHYIALSLVGAIFSTMIALAGFSITSPDTLQRLAARGVRLLPTQIANKINIAEVIPITDLENISQVLAASASAGFLQINSDVKIEGSLATTGDINGLEIKSNDTGFSVSGGNVASNLTVTAPSVNLNQDLSTTSSPTFANLKLSASSNQISVGSLNFTFPASSTTLLGTDTTQTITNKSISGSSNTLTNIPNSALSNSKVTISPGTNMTGGGDVSLGGSVTLTLKDSVALSGTLTVAGATTLSSTLAVSGATTLSSTLATTGAATFSSTVGITGDTTLTGDLAVNGGDITTTATTFNLINATATTLNIGGAATTVSLGASTGTTTVNNDLAVTGNTTLNGNTTIGAAITDTVTFTGRLASGTSIIPIVSGGADLGTSALKFNNLYVNTINAASGSSTSGQAVFTYVPTSTAYSEATVLINPTTASADGVLLDIANAGITKAAIDAEGDLVVGYSSATALTPSTPLAIYNHGTTLQMSVDTSGNIAFGKEADHSISVTDSSTAATAGGAISVVAGAGSTTGAGGTINITTGAGGVTSGASGNLTLATGTAASGANTGAVSIDSGTATGGGTTGAISIGAGAAAKTITIGNATGATALNLTSGTGAQTFTSSVATGTTTTSGFVFTDAALTSGTLNYLTSSSLTTGKLLDVTTGAGNTWTGNGTTNGLVDIASSSTAGTGSAGSILLNLSRSGANSNATHTAYGISSSVTNTGTTSVNVGGLFTATGGVTNRGLEVAAMTGATSTGLTIGAMSGTTANTGVNIGAISGASATGAGITVGNISTTGTTNYGLQLGTMTGGTTSNYQISTGVLTSATTTTNAQLNLGGVVTTGGTTNYGINVGALSGTGTTNYGINVGASTATGTNNYGMNVGALTGAGTNNYGIYIEAPTGGATANVGLYNAGTTTLVGAVTNTGGISGGAGSFTTLTSSGNTTLGTGASGTHTFGSGAGSTVGIGNSTGALTIASGGTSAWTNTSGNLTISTATSGTLALTSAGALDLTAGGTSATTLTSSVATGTTTSSAFVFTPSALTTGTGIYEASSTLTSGKLVDLQISGTAADASQTGLNILTTGANATAGITTYGAQISNTHSTNTSTNVALYLNASGGATANYGLIVDGGNVGIGDASPDALLDLDSADTDGGDFLITNTGIGTSGTVAGITSNSTTSGDIFTISATALTSGSGIVYTGPSGGTAGVTDAALKIASDVGNIGISNGLISSTATIDSTAAGANGVNLYLSTTNSNSTEANTAYGIYNTLSDAIALGNTNYGQYTAVSNTGATTTQTKTIYGSYITASGTGGTTTTPTTNVYGQYLTTTASHATDVGTTNQYGLYIANGTSSTNGTSTKYGLYVESPTGADTNYAAIFAGGNVGIGDSSPSAPLEIGDGTDSIQFSSVGDITFVDANGAATVTGPAGGALNINAANSQNLALSTTTAGNITLTPAATTGLVNILTGNLKVGSGTPGVTQDGEDAYITGTLEVDGATQFDGAVTFNSTQTFNSDLDLTFAGNENMTVTNTTNTLGASGMLDLASTSSTTDTRTLDLSTTFTSTGATTSYGLYNTWASSAVVTGAGVSQTGYGNYTTATKTGLDDATGTYTLYGSYSTASNTGSTDAGTKNTYGGYFTATGDTAGTTKAVGLYASASGADSNYAAIFENGNVGIGTITPTNLVDISQTTTTGDALKVYRNLAAASSDSAVASVVNDNATDDQDTLYVQQDGTGYGLKIYNTNTGTGLVVDQNTTGTNIGLHAYSNVGATANNALAIIEADNVAFDQSALYVENNGTSYGIQLANTGTGEGMLVNQSGTEIGFEVYSNVGATANQALAVIKVDNIAFDKDALYLQNDGVGNALEIAGAGTRNINSTSGNLTISTTTSGTLALDSAGELNMGNTTATSLGIGRTGVTTTNNGALTVSETFTANGDTDIGNLATDTLTITSVVDSNLTFIKEVARTIQIADSTTTNAVGGQLNITGAAGDGSGAGGALVYTAGAGGATGTGGAINITTGAGGVTSGLSGALTLASGTASSGDATGTTTLSTGAATAADSGATTISTGTTTTSGTTGAISIVTGNSAGTSGAIIIDAGTGTATGTIGIGTTSTRAITIGNATGATALNFTSGTGSQTFASSVVSGTTTTSAFVFTDNALTTGTGLYASSSSITQGKLAQLSTGSANTLTTGTLLDIRSTATSLTGAAGVGSFTNIDWSPGSATTATGDLFAINIGTNGTTTGNLFNILDTNSSIFSISETSLTTSLPTNFTSSGDVAIAYDINFTNPTASYIKSIAPINIVAGETFNSSNLTLQTYNQGTVVVDTATTTGTSMNLLSNSLTTGTGLLVNANALTTGTATSISSTSTAGGASGSSYLLSLARSGANANATHTSYGISSSVTNTGTTSVNVGGLFTATGGVTNRGLEVAAMTGATSTGLTIGAMSGTTANTGISVGAITSAATANNFGVNIGAITSQASATSYGINTGAISGAGTATYGINTGANSSTATTNYGMKIGAISGAGTTNYGLYVDTVSGAAANYAAIFAGGNVGIGTVTPNHVLTIDSSINGGAAGSATVVLQGSANKERFEARSFGSSPAGGFQGVGANGTVAAPSATSIDQILTFLGGGGYDNAGTPALTGNKGLIAIKSSQAFTTTAQGTYISFENTPDGSITRAEQARLTSTGNLGIGTTAPDAALEINHATGDSLRLTYNDSNGSAANYTDFSLSSTGALTLTGSAATLAASATAEKTFLTLTPGTITLTAPTQVTSLMETSVITGATIAADLATTVDKATGLSLVAPIDSTNATLTNSSALRILTATSGAGTLTTNAGMYVEAQSAGATNNYGIYIEAPTGGATANVGLYNAGTTTLVGAVSSSGAIDIGTNITFSKEVNHTISVTNSTTTNAVGGQLNITGAAGDGSGNGGALVYTGGAAGATGAGGAINLTSGGSTTGSSGGITLQVGTVGSAGAAGALQILGAAGVASNNVGSTITLTAGNSVGTGVGGGLSITSGTNTSNADIGAVTPGAGGPIAITSGAGAAGTISGAIGSASGPVTLQVGAGGTTARFLTTAGAGGTLSILGGAGGGNANAAVSSNGGAGSAIVITTGAGGALNALNANSATGGAGGTLTLTASNGGGGSTSATDVTGGAGGAISLVAGNGGLPTGTGTITGGAAGAISLTAGTGALTTAGGAIGFSAGQGGATGDGGAINLTTGAGGVTSGTSGALLLKTGTAASGAQSGTTTLSTGAATAADSGLLTLSTGTTTTSGTTGAISIVTGASAGTSGAIVMDVGTGTAGTMSIGATNGRTITIGSTSATSVSITDDNWSVTGAGVANFVSVGATTAGTGTFTDLTVTGNTLIGNAVGDTISIFPTTLAFAKENAHTIQITDSTTADTAGGALTIKGALGVGTGAGGAISLTAGAGGSTSGTGGAIKIVGGAGTAGNAIGGSVSIVAGAGQGSGQGNATTILGGAGGATGLGGDLVFASGAGGSTSGASGNVTLASGTTAAESTSASGAITIQSGLGSNSTGGTAGGASGAVTLRSQAGGTTATGTGGAGGALSITGGAGGAATGAGTGGTGSALTLTAGAGGSSAVGTSGAGGGITLTAGASTAGTSATGAAGGAISLMGGAGSIAANGGAIGFTAGAGGATGAGGAISLTAGAGGASAGTQIGGAVIIAAGQSNVGSVAGGAVTIKGGQSDINGSSVGGAVNITGGIGSRSGAIVLSIPTSVGSNQNGGAISLTAGQASTGNGTGGAISLTAGTGTGSSAGGALVYAAGAGGATGDGGAINLTTGAGGVTSGLSGNLSLATGTASSGDATGTTTLSTGNATAADSGATTVSTGTTTTSGTSGAISIVTGNSAGTAGSIVIDVGTSASGNGTIGIGTAARATTVTLGNATGASALAFNSGTGSQTFTSQVATGTTTTSAFVFDATAITTGTGAYLTSDSITQGKLLQLSTAAANTLTTGTLLDIRSTATSLTGTAGVGSFTNIDWSPGSATTATGDLFAINIGTNGTTTGNLFNILDTNSSIFSISETSLTTSLPTNFTSSGDVAIAYDINFTNPTASYIKSNAPLYIQAGPTYANNDLTLQTFGTGSVIVSQSVATTGSPTALQVIGAAHTTLTASTEATDINFNLARTVQFATGALTNQRAIQAQAPTYGFVGASTLTNAATFYIDRAPQAGTNATITNPYALWVDAGNSRFDGDIIGTDGTNSVNVITATAASSTVFNETGADIDFRIESDTNANAFTIDAGLFGGAGAAAVGSVPDSTVLFWINAPTATGPANNNLFRAAVDNNNILTVPTGTAPVVATLLLEEPNITATGTVTAATTLYISSAPTEAANNYALWADAGLVRFDGDLQQGDGTTTTTKTTGFLDINTTAGLPTGVPSPLPSGTVPMTFDTTNNKICRYSAGWQCLGGFADYSEWAPAKDAQISEIVTTTANPNPVNDPTAPFMLAKTSTPYDSKIVGVISKYAEEGNSANGYKLSDDYHAVALVGRVPVKVSTENGPIQKGDFLTSSSVPGVAMKATRSGFTLGKAMEDYNQMNISTIVAFIQPAYADPGNFFASLSMDDAGNLIVPKLKAENFILSTNIDVSRSDNKGLVAYSTNNTVSNQPSYDVDVISSLKNLETAVINVSDLEATTSAKLANLQTDVATQSAALASQLASASAALAQTKSDVESLKLTPPETLLATVSATLVDLKVSSEATFSGKLTAYDSVISNSFKSLGTTTLGSTTVAGDVSIDGTLSITTGNTINSIGTLYLQNSALATAVDLFNGAITIDNNGKLTAQSISAKEYLGVSGTTVGSGKILAGSKSVIINSTLVKTNSRILVTPTTESSQTLSVTTKTAGESFTVSVPFATVADIDFDWFIINESN